MRIGGIILLVAGLMILSTHAWGQKVEVGLLGGTSYYMGDLNPDTHFQRPEPAFGGFARYNLNPHISGRFSLLYMEVGGSEVKSPYIISDSPTDPFSFQTSIMEAALVAEVNFLPFEAGNPNTRYSPFIFGGIGGLMFDYIDTDTGVLEPDDLNILGDPDKPGFSHAYLFGAGFKFYITRYLTGGIEWGMRYTDTDYLDLVSLKGNPKNNDWYSFAGLSLSIRFKDRDRAVCPY